MSSVAELKERSLEQLREYAEDVRQSIISTCLANGGHLGASLGAVEIAIALHYVFNSPQDALVWDVGHQAYAHKIITGRADRFHTLRKFGGISGFLSRDESEHDIFGAGHSSTALSAALAIAWANGQKNKSNWTVAIVGDGGLTAGVAFEALNNVRAQAIGPLLVVLNDNQMSISPNVGAIPAILSGSNTKEFFDFFGFDYVGPVNGHNLEEIIGSLQGIQQNVGGRPILLHALTQKGRGYEPAEENPGSYHGVSPAQGSKKKSFSDAFGQAVCKAAKADERVVAVTAAMPEGTGLNGFAREFPERFFDVGIAEPHAVTFAAGLATQGFRPVVAIYSTFLQRGLDAIIHDVALQNLPVILAVDRAGLVGADGPTHHGMFDLAYLGMIPNMRILAPENLDDVETCLEEALNSNGPVAIRYPRGSAPERFKDQAVQEIQDGLRWHLKRKDPSVIVISVGAAGGRVSEAIAKVDKQLAEVSRISVVRVKPIPAELMAYLAENPNSKILCIEDGIVQGGFGQKLLAEVSNRGSLIGYGDHFVPHGSPADLEKSEALSSSDIAEAIRQLLS